MAESQRFLVAEHEQHIVRLLQVNLERAGHDVRVAHDGNGAISLLNSCEFDQAILDFTMPSPNGYDVLEYIRNNEQTARIWVRLLVPSSQIEEVMARPYKADSYSGKASDRDLRLF